MSGNPVTGIPAAGPSVKYQYLSGEAQGTGILLPTLPEAPVTPPRFERFLTLDRCVVASQPLPRASEGLAVTSGAAGK